MERHSRSDTEGTKIAGVQILRDTSLVYSQVLHFLYLTEMHFAFGFS